MQISATAKAPATVANQPAFDMGGFPVKVIKTVAGNQEKWETLQDEVDIIVNLNRKNSKITVRNILVEDGVSDLPAEVLENTAGRIVKFCIDYLKEKEVDFPYDIEIVVRKGLSVKGTGLGSSGATVAAAFKALESVLEKMEVKEKISEDKLIDLFIEADFGVPDNSVPSYLGGLVKVNINEAPVRIERIKKHKDFGYFVVVTPKGVGIKTQDARNVLRGKKPPDNNLDLVSQKITAIKTGDAKKYGELMEEVHGWFVGPRSRLYPKQGQVYDKVKEAAKRAGAFGVTISGSGPTVLAVVSNLDIAEKVGLAMYLAFEESGYDSIARIVDIDDLGAKIVD